MNPRSFSHRWLPGLVAWLDRVNQRHPWSHNDHFHGWILRHLPERGGLALEVGCGRGGLLEKLAARFDRVHGTDRDREMRDASRERVSRCPNASVSGARLVDLDGPYDLITMVAVLHHLDADGALADCRRLLAPGGRLLVVGLARPQSGLDWAWDAFCLVVNPLIGLATHPRRAAAVSDGPGFPVLDPEDSYAELQRVFERRLPGARLRRRLGFRYTALWTKPTAP